MLFNNENSNIELAFNYICSISNLDHENLTINIALVLDVEDQMEKRKILLKKWNTLTAEEQIKFYENINEHDFNHYSMIV
tara:strand:- start:84 stop:323 length:240 start_codon:yes stop_codon:yes gene_type:complete